MRRREPLPIATKAAILGAVLIIIILGGGAIYAAIEGVGYLNAVYSVVMIMTGIGSSRDADTTAGKVFNMILALVSVGILVSVLGHLFRFFSSRSLHDVMNAIHDKKVRAMSGHTIICGCSHTLHELLIQMEHRDHAWVIVKTEQEAKRIEHEGFHAHVDDYTTEAAMKRAGIDKAGCVIACGENDAENAFIVLTAKHMRPTVPVIARLSRTENRGKLKSAGADTIVAPAELAALQIRDAMRAMITPDEGLS